MRRDLGWSRGCLTAAFVVLLLALAGGGAIAGASVAGDVNLLGASTVLPRVDYNPPGAAEAFRATASASGTVSSLSVYVDAKSAASKLVAGIYAESGGRPGTLLAQGSVTPKAGSWNTISLAAFPITSGSAYWIAIVGTGGRLYYRDNCCSSSAALAVVSSLGNLSSLPTSWSSGQTYKAGPLSAYATGPGGSTTPPTTTTTPADTQAPTIPSGLAASSVTQTSLSLSWTASTDNVGVAGYKLSVNGSQVGTTSSNSYAFSGLACGTSYTLGVAAYDAAGNVSQQATKSASTAACPSASSLLGTSAVAAGADWNPPGMAEAFKATAAASGSVSSLSVYVDTGSTASTLVAGIYTDSSGRPGALLAQGSMTPNAGAWNKVDLSTQLSAGVTYWIAVLGPTGTLRYRDTNGGATAIASAQTSLASLPSSWTNGASYNAGPVSAYALGVAGGGSAPPADTQAPTIPSGLAASSVTQTSLSLSWTASTDNVGVAGYKLSVNGSQVGTTSSNSYAFSGLACGTSYTLGVAAFDAAGNVSQQATVTVATAACSTGGANLYLSPSGSDSGSCTQAAPCLSFDRAYHLALPGQTVALLAGSYSSQAMSADASKTGPAAVTFTPAPGASVQVAGLDNEGASFLTLDNLAFTGQIMVQNQDPGSLGAHNVTLRSDSAKTVRIVGQVSDISIRGGSYGNTVDSQPQIKKYNPTDPDSAAPSNILIDGVSFHDFRRSNATVHTECLQILNGSTITVRKSLFWNCDGTGDIGITPNSPIVNLTMENNFIAGGGDTGYGIQIGTEQRNFVFRNNSSTQPIFFSDSISGYGPYTFTGNYIPHNAQLCRSSATYSHNVIRGGTCSATDVNVPVLSFVDAANHNLHLAAGALAIDAGDPSSFPSDDVDGQSRPMGGAPDAGADESR